MSGHRTLPHTADIRIEAWAPTREACVAEAVAALVASFLSLPAGVDASGTSSDVTGETDADLLASALDEVIYLTEVRELVPAEVDVVPVAGGLRLVLRVVPLAAAEVVGAVPKAVTLHDLCLSATGDTWTATAVVDV